MVRQRRCAPCPTLPLGTATRGEAVTAKRADAKKPGEVCWQQRVGASRTSTLQTRLGSTCHGALTASVMAMTRTCRKRQRAYLAHCHWEVYKPHRCFKWAHWSLLDSRTPSVCRVRMTPTSCCRWRATAGSQPGRARKARSEHLVVDSVSLLVTREHKAHARLVLGRTSLFHFGQDRRLVLAGRQLGPPARQARWRCCSR